MISTTAISKTFSGDGSTTSFPVTEYIILDDDHLVITHIDADSNRTVLSKTTDYTVGVNADKTFTVYYPVSGDPLASTEFLEVKRSTPKDQTLDLLSTSQLPVESLEEALDKLTMQMQEVVAGEGASDHGALSGLTDDDHAQYHNASRADTWLGTKTLDDITIGTTNKHFTAADETKLDGIETGATADQSNSEIEAAYNAQVGQVSSGEKTAGTETSVRRFSPDDIRDMVIEHAPGGSAGVTSVFGRTGAVVAVSGDYTAAQVTNAFDTTSNTLDDITIGTTNKHFTAADETKLDGIETGAEVTSQTKVDAKMTRIAVVPITSIGGSVAVGDGKAKLPIPSNLNGFNLIGVILTLETTSSSGLPTYQVRRRRGAAEVDMLSTRVSCDVGERSSINAATPAIINTSNDDLATGDDILFDKDVIGTGELGDIVTLIFRAP